MSITFFDRLWQMHDETKALVLFRPLELIRNSSKDNVFQQKRDDAPSVEGLEEAPAEHTQRIRSGPDGIKEDDPKPYTSRQKAGLFFGPFLFILMPIVLFGIMHTKAAASPYASHLIFLFMGGFIIGLAMQRWNLHRHIAMNIVRIVGFSPGRLIFGFMVANPMKLKKYLV